MRHFAFFLCKIAKDLAPILGNLVGLKDGLIMSPESDKLPPNILYEFHNLTTSKRTGQTKMNCVQVIKVSRNE